MAEVHESSILDDVKTDLMISPDDPHFDGPIIMAINTAFVALHDLGVGPDPAFEIHDKNAKWSDFIGLETSMSSVKTYVSLTAKDDFDNTGTSYQITARKNRIDKIGWMLMIAHDRTAPKRVNADPLAGLGG